MQSDIDASKPQPELDLEKSLAVKKLTLEVAELERPWWKRPNYILAALPTLLAIVALSVGFLNGFFSAQLTKLENQKHDLQIQIAEFEAKKDDLHQHNAALEKENKQLIEITAMLENSTKRSLDAYNEALRRFEAATTRARFPQAAR